MAGGMEDMFEVSCGDEMDIPDMQSELDNGDSMADGQNIRRGDPTNWS